MKELKEHPCQQLHGGTGASIYENEDGLCSHPDCNPDNEQEKVKNLTIPDVVNCDCETNNHTKHESTGGIVIYKCKDCGGCL